MQTILGQSGAVQNMVSRVEELVKNITQVETEQEQQRAGVEEDIRRKVGDGLSKMQRDLDNSIPRMVDMHLSEFAKKVEQSMHTLKDAVVNDRFNDQQRSHDLRNASTTLQAKVDSQEQRLSIIGEQVGTVDFELTANKYVDHQELREVTKEMNGVTDNMDEVEQEIEQVKAMLQVQLGRPAPVHQSAPRFFDLSNQEEHRTIPTCSVWDLSPRPSPATGTISASPLKEASSSTARPGTTAVGGAGSPLPSRETPPTWEGGSMGFPRSTRPWEGAETPLTPGNPWDFPVPPGSPPTSRQIQEEVPLVTSTPVDESLPRFGLTGRVAPDDWSEFRSMERRLTELPKLSIPSGEAWERNMILNTWIKEVVLATTSVSMPFSDFVAGVFDKARTRYVYQKANPRLKMDSAPSTSSEFPRVQQQAVCDIVTSSSRGREGESLGRSGR